MVKSADAAVQGQLEVENGGFLLVGRKRRSPQIHRTRREIDRAGEGGRYLMEMGTVQGSRIIQWGRQHCLASGI